MKPPLGQRRWFPQSPRQRDKGEDTMTSQASERRLTTTSWRAIAEAAEDAQDDNNEGTSTMIARALEALAKQVEYAHDDEE